MFSFLISSDLFLYFPSVTSKRRTSAVPTANVIVSTVLVPLRMCVYANRVGRGISATCFVGRISGVQIARWIVSARTARCAIRTQEPANVIGDSLENTATRSVPRISLETSARSCVAARTEALAITSMDFARVQLDGQGHSK